MGYIHVTYRNVDSQLTFRRKQSSFYMDPVFDNTVALFLTVQFIRWKTTFQVAVDSIISFFAGFTKNVFVINDNLKKNVQVLIDKNNVTRQVRHVYPLLLKVYITNKNKSWNKLLNIIFFIQFILYDIQLMFYIIYIR